MNEVFSVGLAIFEMPWWMDRGIDGWLATLRWGLLVLTVGVRFFGGALPVVVVWFRFGRWF
jgi:hypothetical protein